MKSLLKAVRLTCVLAPSIVFMGSGAAIAASRSSTGPSVKFACDGPAVEAARKTAVSNGLKLGMDPKACFGEMKLTESARKQIVVALASPRCKTGKLLDVYDRSRAGSWYSLFKQPICGTAISVGPKSPYGHNLITIDGRRYIDKAGAFVPFK